MKRIILVAIISSILSGCVTPVPNTVEGRSHFFTKEKHSIVAGKCGWLGDLYVVTGENPVMLIGDTASTVTKSLYTSDAYVQEFNGGSLTFIYDPLKQAASVSDKDSTTLCHYAFVSK